MGDVQLAAGVPFRPGAIPLQHFVPWFEPVQFAADLPPECFGIGFGLLVQALIFLHALNDRAGLKRSGRIEDAILSQCGLDVGLIGRHGNPFSVPLLTSFDGCYLDPDPILFRTMICRLAAGPASSCLAPSAHSTTT